MRICRVAKRFPPLPGGLELHARDLSIQQVRDGNEVEVFILFGDHHFQAARVTVHKVPGGGWVRFLRKDTLISLAYILLCVPCVWRAHRRRAFDVVHLHGDLFEALQGVLLTRILRIPSVVTIHAGLNTKRVYRILAGYLFRRVSGIIANSHEIRQELISLGVPEEKVAASHSGVWYDRFNHGAVREGQEGLRAKLGVSPGEIVGVSVGRLHPMKGYKYLVQAAASLSPPLPLKLFIIGDGPERQRLAELAASTGGRVQLLGTRAHTEVPALLGVADMFVLPSVSLPGQRESTPTALMEAMAAGLPIVATPTGGIKDLIEDGVNGYLVQERDEGALAQAFQKLGQDETLRHRMGQENRRRAQAFDWSQVAAQVAESYVRAGAMT